MSFLPNNVSIALITILIVNISANVFPGTQDEYDVCSWGRNCITDPELETSLLQYKCRELGRVCGGEYPMLKGRHKCRNWVGQLIYGVEKIECTCGGEDSLEAGCIDTAEFMREKFYKTTPTYDLKDPAVKQQLCGNSKLYSRDFSFADAFVLDNYKMPCSFEDVYEREKLGYAYMCCRTELNTGVKSCLKEAHKPVPYRSLLIEK